MRVERHLGKVVNIFGLSGGRQFRLVFGDSEKCQSIRGNECDSERNLLFILEVLDSRPIVHVYSILLGQAPGPPVISN